MTLLVQSPLLGLLCGKSDLLCFDTTLFRLLRFDTTLFGLLCLDTMLFITQCRQSALPVGMSLSIVSSLLLRSNCGLLRFGLLAKLATRLRREARLGEC